MINSNDFHEYTNTFEQFQRWKRMMDLLKESGIKFYIDIYSFVVEQTKPLKHEYTQTHCLD